MMRLIAAAFLLPVVLAAGGLEPAVLHIHEDAAGKLDMLGEVAVVMTGNDRFINRIMEDVLAIKLMAAGIKVAYPEEAHFGKPREDIEVDPVAFARRVGANAVVTGTVITEPPGEWQFRTVKVSIASLSLLDVAEDKSLVWALYEPEVATTSSRVAAAFADELVSALK